MSKKYYINLAFTSLAFIIILSSCEKPEPPSPDFYANEYSSTNKEITIAFTDISTDNPQEWIWTFEGGTPSISYERDPIVTYNEAGTFNVTLTVRNGDGSREITKYDYINIGDFYNPTWADIYITHNSEDKMVPVDDYILLSNIDNPVISYYAETSGYFTYGGATDIPVGLLIYWNSNVNLDEAVYWDFIIEDYFVFINVQNYGPDDLTPLIVNWGDTDYEIIDYITIPNDGLWRSTGYYDAWDFMEIRAYFENDPNTYVEWIEDYHFDLLWVVNQGLDLWYDGSKSNLKSKVKSKDLRKNGAKPIKQSGVKR
ncbi:MAG: hypothetical protein C0597_12860 [Marinilabiliales bacterium]|nr:MAG: hypothetical protein C0597_12860 [Marinilabiliales bacterium]